MLLTAVIAVCDSVGKDVDRRFWQTDLQKRSRLFHRRSVPFTSAYI